MRSQFPSHPCLPPLSLLQISPTPFKRNPMSTTVHFLSELIVLNPSRLSESKIVYKNEMCPKCNVSLLIKDALTQPLRQLHKQNYIVRLLLKSLLNYRSSWRYSTKIQATVSKISLRCPWFQKPRS